MSYELTAPQSIPHMEGVKTEEEVQKIMSLMSDESMASLHHHEKEHMGDDKHVRDCLELFVVRVFNNTYVPYRW